MTRIVSRSALRVTTFFREARSRAPVFVLCVFAAGCSYIFSEKRTVYQYDPSYGVDSPEFLRSLDALGTEMVVGNRAELLENGDGAFPSMLEAIAAATVSINFEIYIFDHGEIGTRFARALGERARAGVEVRLLVDGFGSKLGPLQAELETAGVLVRI
jgi:cardiolipin synthase